MLNLSILITNLLNAMIFTQINHPMAMTLIIIMQTLIVALTTGMMTSTFWFSYILFLVFLGGMLVLFIYITSLASNELFSIPTKSLIIILVSLSMIILISLISDSTLWNMLSFNEEMNNIDNEIITLHDESNYLLTKLYNKPTDLITLMLVNYLFLTLIAIVKITNIFQGPLRPKN
uniref:NADH-ubiquinone oxidoreductase chain 6 n=1 Tax=Xizicus fascipes TaxID=948382 RepID=J9PV84_XIZFA|nr:NADH dehydrogenase subunit 6 [Xizicus fascipes]AFA36645.1 NADH dehydrogenase subunit 6 [Xizicus fascipes]UZH35971.1 NADH dehydrogenase subunit 6 [Xizicus fascipes]